MTPFVTESWPSMTQTPEGIERQPVSAGVHRNETHGRRQRCPSGQIRLEDRLRA